MIKINFERTYEPFEIAEDLSFMTFFSVDKQGFEILLKIEITSLGDLLLPNVYNLAFVPLSDEGKIDDKAKINHSDADKMFSTVLFFWFSFFASKSKEFSNYFSLNKKSVNSCYERQNSE